MADEVVDTPTPPAPEQLAQADVAEILREYQRKQLMMSMIGPIVSLVVHVTVLTCVAVLWTGQSSAKMADITVTIEEVKVKELEEPVMEEIEDTPEDVTEDAPTVDAPVAPSESTAVSSALEDVSDAAPSSDDKTDVDEVTDVEMTTSPLKLAGYYGGRSSAGRAKLLAKGRGGKKGQDAVMRALRWLAEVQSPDGSWASQPAHSGMALLAFLAHGETPLSEDFGVTVQKAMQWLANAMNNIPEGGMCGGRAYSHGISTYALSEAYGMTRIPFLRTAMEKGITTIIKGQQDRGGYDYEYAKGARWDMSVCGWQFQALKAAYVSGATAPGLQEAIEKSVKFIRRDTVANGRSGYSSPGSGGNMTGVAATALQLLGYSDCREAKAMADTISVERLNLYKAMQTNPAAFHDGAGGSIYGWYYDTQVMFNIGGKYWKDWNPVFQEVLTKNQNPAGYWEVKSGPGMDPTLPGKILTTCWCVLQLEVYYRYLPTFDIKKMDAHRTTGSEGGADAAGEAATGLVIE